MDLLHAFHFFAGELGPKELIKTATESFANPVALEPIGRTVGMSFEVGQFGEEGTLTDVTTMTESGKFTKNDARSVTTQSVMLLPPRGTSALVFIERAQGRSGVVRVLDLFAEKFRRAYPDYILETESIVETEAWLKHAQVTRISAHAIKKSSDKAGNLPSSKPVVTEPVGELAHTLVPMRGKKFIARSIYDRLTAGALKPGQLLAFNDDEEASAVEITMSYNNQTKTFILGREKSPSLSLQITRPGEDAWDLNKFCNFAFDRAGDLFKRLKLEWSETDSIGAWTEEDLARKLVVKDVKDGEQA
ncbi:hypothetical protein A6I85_17255 [Prescottella equi]|nr:hypothetical protein A6I85_17255 [Prescottella equi]